MSEQIAIRGIRVYGRHGVFSLEQSLRQPLDIDVELEADLSAARTSDRLDDTVDYGQLHAAVVRIAEDQSYALLERLAAQIGKELTEDTRVRVARVTVAKPRLLAGATPSVTVETRSIT